jgi:hypothetical protein
MPSKMNSNQWIALECLIGLLIIGLATFFWKPQYEFGAGAVITALVSALNNSLGVQSGSRMPEQAGDAKPGQASQTKTTSETSTQAPAEEPK